MSRFRRELQSCVRPLPAGQLIDRGVSKHVLDGPRWRRTARGFYVPARTSAATPTQRIVEAATTIPTGAAIGGWAAAYASGVDRLDGLDDHSMRPLPVPILLRHGLHRGGAAGIRYLQQTLAPDDMLRVGGMPFSHPRRTALDLARWAPNVTEAVVALDAMLDAKVITIALLHSALRNQGSSRLSPGTAGRRTFPNGRTQQLGVSAADALRSGVGLRGSPCEPGGL